MTCKCFAYFLRICQIYAGVVQILCRYLKQARTYLQNICEHHADMVQIRTNPLQTKCSTVTDMWQIFADILHICQFGKGKHNQPALRISRIKVPAREQFTKQAV